jgi:hypothetical protein
MSKFVRVPKNPIRPADIKRLDATFHEAEALRKGSEIDEAVNSMSPDPVIETLKQEASEISTKLKVISRLKTLESPLRKRAKYIEKCITELISLGEKVTETPSPAPSISFTVEQPIQTSHVEEDELFEDFGK